jgi:hypothetical protein
MQGSCYTSSNPYFDIQSIRFFTGDYNAVNNENKTLPGAPYRDNTQYLYIEFISVTSELSHGTVSIVFNWYNAAGLLKARIERFRKVKAEAPEELIVFNEGWGRYARHVEGQ